MLIRTLMLGVALATISSAVQAQTTTAPAPQQQPQNQASAAMQDPATFTSMAAIGDLFEVRSSELALERSQNQQVQAFAQQMIADHSNASQRLTEAAAQEGWQAPTELDERHQSMLEELQAQEGEAFDAAYLQAQVQAHDEAVALFEGYAGNGPDGPLKTHATETLPVLQQHQQHVRQLASAGQSSGTRTDSGQQSQQQAQAAQQPAQQTAQQQPAGQQPAQQQPAVAEQCLADLQAYSQQLNEEQFWVTGWGNRWGVGEPAAVGNGMAADGMASPWSAVESDLRSPRAQIRQLYGAGYVLAYQGDEEGCQYLVQILDRTYQGYAEQLSAAGLQPEQITDWRQEQLALAQPVTELEQMQRMTLDDVTGTDVRNAQDESLGSVSDVTIDTRTGQITYAIIARGGFLGIGEDHVAVPWNQFRATPGLNTLVLDVTPEVLDQAPSVDPDTFGDPSTFAQQNEQITQYWSQART